MNKFIGCFVFVLMVQSTFCQVLRINELDCDTFTTESNSDNNEFIELKSQTPNFSLDGYVVVFFNGSNSGGNMSYLALDLDGFETDINGLLLIGSANVSPSPQYLIPTNIIQNGVDAVAIYQADDIDFEEPVLAYVDDTLIDVLLYRTTQNDGTGLIPLFSAFNPDIQIISEGGSNNSNSIQLDNGNNDVGYLIQTPTPRILNDGSGIILNGISITIAQVMYNEGDTFDIILTSEESVSSDLTFTLGLDNGTFNSDDFSGTTTITISSGTNTATTSITVLDDLLDEGDEVMQIQLLDLPPTFSAINNNLRVRVVDNDFTTAAFGTPINPSYGIVTSTQPEGYYDSIDGLADFELRDAIQEIIAEEGVVRAQTYTDVIDILYEADQNPLNSNEVWLVYKEVGRSKLDYQFNSISTGKWNREHTYPRSRGGFYSIEIDEISDGKEIFWNTTADSLRHGNSDAHALRAADGPENSSRGNQFYGQYNGPVGTLGSFKGDVARSVLYMALRYTDLQVVNGFPEGNVGQFGDLATILEWHRNDPPDDFEMNRNNVVYTWQMNRNPLIDYPELVEHIWGNRIGIPFNMPLGIGEQFQSEFQVYPNPAQGRIFLKGIMESKVVEIYGVDGRRFSDHMIENRSYIDLNLPSGLYILKIRTQGIVHITKLVVK